MATKTTKKVTKKAAPRKAAPKKTSVRKTKSDRVDIYPNRMALAVATAAAVCLVLFGVLALYS